MTRAKFLQHVEVTTGASGSGTRGSVVRSAELPVIYDVFSNLSRSSRGINSSRASRRFVEMRVSSHHLFSITCRVAETIDAEENARS